MNNKELISSFKNEYKQLLNDSTDNFDSFFKEMKLKISVLTGDLESSAMELSREINKKNKELETVIETNHDLTNKLSQLTNSDAGAIGMFSDSKNMYIQKLVATLLLVFTMVGFVLYFYKNKLISFGFDTKEIKNKTAGLVNNVKRNLNPQSTLSVLQKAKPNLFT